MSVSGGTGGGIQAVTNADTTIKISGTETAVAIAANVGTGAGTVAAGNDARFGEVNGVAVSGVAGAGQVLTADGPTTAHWGAVAGTGNVVGPATSTAGHYATYADTTGKLLADAGALTVTTAQISDATTVGKQLVTAADAPTARAAIGAGTSSLVIGTVTGTAMDGATTAAQIGGATAAQGTLAATALQPATGIVVVNSGSNAATARPAGAAAVYWIGSVAPTNAVAGDLGFGW